MVKSEDSRPEARNLRTLSTLRQQPSFSLPFAQLPAGLTVLQRSFVTSTAELQKYHGWQGRIHSRTGASWMASCQTVVVFFSGCFLWLADCMCREAAWGASSVLTAVGSWDQWYASLTCVLALGRVQVILPSDQICS